MVLAAYLRDNVNARGLQYNGSYERIQLADGEKRSDSQLNLAAAAFTPSRNNITSTESALPKLPSRQEYLPLSDLA